MRTLALLKASIIVGTSMVLEVNRPRLKIPSIGYVKKSLEVFEADQIDSGKFEACKTYGITHNDAIDRSSSVCEV